MKKINFLWYRFIFVNLFLAIVWAWYIIKTPTIDPLLILKFVIGTIVYYGYEINNNRKNTAESEKADFYCKKFIIIYISPIVFTLAVIAISLIVRSLIRQ